MNTLTAAPALASRLTCEHSHGIGSDDTAAVKVCSLTTTQKNIVDLEANRVPAKRRKLGFAIAQWIEQQAGLELVSNFGIGKAVDETLDSHFFRGKSNRRHDGPPRRQIGLGSLAVPAADSSSFRRQESSEVRTIGTIHV